jgi:[ribosomal protein S5]-alanine N-acetyltransferase
MISFKPLHSEDVREIAKWFQYDPEFPRDFSPFSWSISKDAFISKVQDTISNENSEINFYSVFEDSLMVGLLLSIKPDNFNFFEVGYYIIPSERGRGHGREAVKQLTELLFKNENIRRIEAGTSSLNLSSQKLLEKLGFQKEAIRRKTLYRNGRWEDSYLYALIK